MTYNHLAPALDRDELSACFMACADQPPVSTNHNFIQYNISLPVGMTPAHDQENMQNLLSLLTQCGLTDITPKGGVYEGESDFPARQGEFSYQFALTRQNHEQSARAYAKRNDLPTDLGLEEYLKHSGREARICVQFNIHPDDLETVKGALSSKHTIDDAALEVNHDMLMIT